MASNLKPVNPVATVFLAVFATFCFTASSMSDSGLRWVLMGVGIVLLILAIVGITASRRGAPESGWLPSRERSGKEPE